MQIDIHRIRRFNRAVTTEVGALDKSFMGRGRPLGAARVLNAIGHGKHDINALRAYLDLDSGLMSRLLRGLESEGLVETSQHTEDARRRTVRLTAKGQTEFIAYEKLSNNHAAEILNRHPRPEELLQAMDLIASVLGRDRIEITEADPQGDEARYCLKAYYSELERRLDQGFDVNLSRDPDTNDMQRPRGSFLLAMSDVLPIGCVALKGSGKPIAEIKRLWVSPAARGLKLATRLMDRAEAIARDLGIQTLRLDTNSALPEAAALYHKLGWTEIDRFNDDPYPDMFFEKHL